MSKSYDDCCLEVGLDRTILAPELVFQWVAYEGGKSIPCPSMNAAMKYSLYEKITTAEAILAHSNYFTDRENKETLATKLFLAHLREDYFHIPDNLYDICYSEAYDRGHAYGFDEIANCMNSVVEFVEKIQKLK